MYYVNSAGGAGVCAVAVPQRVPGAVGPDSGQGAGQEQGAVHVAVQAARRDCQEEEGGQPRLFLVRSVGLTEQGWGSYFENVT